MIRIQAYIDENLNVRLKTFLIKKYGSVEMSKFIISAIEEKLDKEEEKQ